MKIKLLLGLIVITGFLFSCKKLFFIDVECRDFQFKGENYWFPLNAEDTVVFINYTTNVRKKYTVMKKRIYHRTKYVSDLGCGCFDDSGMLLTSGTDSLWFNNELSYIEDKEGDYYEGISFVNKGKRFELYEAHRTHLDTFVLNSVVFSDVEFFECKTCKDVLSVKKLYRAKNIGIISFELANGEVWINENLTKTGILTIDSFEFSENTCE